MPIASRSHTKLLEAFDETFRVSNHAGFRIKSLHVDPEFELLYDAMIDNDIIIVPVPAQQHVPEIERTIKAVKERYRAAYYSLPFQAIPKVLIKALAKRVVKFLNMFPPKGGVCTHWSPCAIVTGKPLDYNINCVCPFGSFVQALNEPNPLNTPAPRSLDAIYLDANDETMAGGYKCMHLASGKEITHHKVTPVPMA